MDSRLSSRLLKRMPTLLITTPTSISTALASTGGMSASKLLRLTNAHLNAV